MFLRVHFGEKRCAVRRHAACGIAAGRGEAPGCEAAARHDSRSIPLSSSRPNWGGCRLLKNPLPKETEPGSNLAASQSFPARRRENKVKIFKIPGHVPGILTYDRASVRLWRARSPMQILLRSKPALIESVSKRLFRHAEVTPTGVAVLFLRMYFGKKRCAVRRHAACVSCVPSPGGCCAHAQRGLPQHAIFPTERHLFTHSLYSNWQSQGSASTCFGS